MDAYGAKGAKSGAKRAAKKAEESKAFRVLSHEEAMKAIKENEIPHGV
jgi:hypothetical protein